jgi:universal stress protein A
MRKLDKLLCPIDFSEASLEALRYAAGLARGQGARIELLHVHHVPLHQADVHAPKSVDQLPAELRKELMRKLEQVKTEQAPGVEVALHLAVGTPHEAIIEAAKRLDADVIVIGTHGHGGLARMLLGSVTDRVLRTSDRPVLTVGKQ